MDIWDHEKVTWQRAIKICKDWKTCSLVLETSKFQHPNMKNTR